ncbi:exo-beta-N-acetylmuramidase NamZ family protein [Solitalea koreensis]|uniref:Uncharacterized conserved protein YbbC, DUF1343 family n=1 Tax=Solitalea koreensis TaxID=543615 RepID=A0A521DWN8_9SPHI|nr:DUF1343 domain-containing protein [Solitalea koreensis]SMO76055.1 Uncharacterized conserved protein YbbC, DUF1343 family [Solitalea koreensis]
MNKLLISIITFFTIGIHISRAQLTIPLSKGMPPVVVGAAQTNEYLPKLKGKTIAIVVNQTSMIGNIHLVDSLLHLGINIKTVFAPEHGFRGDADAGEKVDNSVDAKTHLPIVSLYGKHYKPYPEDLKGVDIVIFDIQDVGVRFYTYISTLHYLMEACAENNVDVMVFDRPNPNGFYVDGPILDPKFKSFVGMHPVPIVHGLTIGEYAQMINGEKWLKDGIQCKLSVISMKNWDHSKTYILPIKPSPNLPNNQAVLLYPSICLFEGTEISLARGTSFPFQAIGAPALKDQPFSFTPVSIQGMSKNPPHENQECHGVDLRNFDTYFFKKQRKLNLKWLLNMYKIYPDKEKFFLPTLFFDKLAGSDQLRKQLIAGKSESEIRASWEPGLSNFKKMRTRYLLYRDY